jgi:cytochrome c oxidase assembly protein subunit 11
MAAGAYFNKVECFCFTETTLQPGETLKMPVVFFVDPEIVKAVETKGINTITLSYTFYPASRQSRSRRAEGERRKTTNFLTDHSFRLSRK